MHISKVVFLDSELPACESPRGVRLFPEYMFQGGMIEVQNRREFQGCEPLVRQSRTARFFLSIVSMDGNES